MASDLTIKPFSNSSEQFNKLTIEQFNNCVTLQHAKSKRYKKSLQ